MDRYSPREIQDIFVHLCREALASFPKECCGFIHGQVVRHKIQGLAIGYRTPNLDLNVIDEIVTVPEEEARQCMLNLMRFEGIGSGPGTGANLAAALRVGLPGERILSFAYDSCNDYLDFLRGDDNDSSALV